MRWRWMLLKSSGMMNYMTTTLWWSCWVTGLTQHHVSQFHGRSWRHHEDADSFADTITELCRGYPQSSLELHQELISEQFVRGQSDPEPKKWVVIRTQNDRKLQTLIEVCTDFARLNLSVNIHRPVEQTSAVEEDDSSEEMFAMMDRSQWTGQGVSEPTIPPSLAQMFAIVGRMGYEMRPITRWRANRRNLHKRRLSPDRDIHVALSHFPCTFETFWIRHFETWMIFNSVNWRASYFVIQICSLLRDQHGSPIRCAPHRMSPQKMKKEEECVAEMLAGGQIEPSDSPWSSPVVLVTKKDGGNRFCVDYRRLNYATVKDAYPWPRIDDTLEIYWPVSGGSGGYWQVSLLREARIKTAFATHSGLFQFKLIPFGLIWETDG